MSFAKTLFAVLAFADWTLISFCAIESSSAVRVLAWFEIGVGQYFFIADDFLDFVLQSRG